MLSGAIKVHDAIMKFSSRWRYGISGKTLFPAGNNERCREFFRRQPMRKAESTRRPALYRIHDARPRQVPAANENGKKAANESRPF